MMEATEKFMYLWLKKVEGFNDKVHCASCLKGKYSKVFGLKMTAGETVILPYEDGDILYFCGVAKPYRWENNMHLAGVVEAGHPAFELILHTGAKMIVENIRPMTIEAEPAERLYPQLPKAFLTCRNFQFGVQYYASGEQG
jgi:hypothetical protein